MLKELLLRRKMAKYNKQAADDGRRPVKFVPDGYNSWRVVWADERK